MGKVYDFDIPDDDYFLRLTDGKEIEIEGQERMAEELTSNTLGSGKRTSYAGKQEKQKKPVNKKAVILTLIAAAGVTAGIKLTSYVMDRIDYQVDARAATEIVAAEEQAKFLNNGLGFLSENGEYVIKDNTVEDYKEKLGDVTPKELYAIKEIVNEKELHDIVVSMGYNNIDEYYKSLGYVDKDTDTPSEEVFNNYMEAEIVPLYRNGTLLVNKDGKGLN